MELTQKKQWLSLPVFTADNRYLLHPLQQNCSIAAADCSRNHHGVVAVDQARQLPLLGLMQSFP